MRLQSIFFFFCILRASSDSPAVPLKVGSECDGGEALQRHGGTLCFIAHAGYPMKVEPQVAGDDGYWGCCIIFHPFKNCLRSKLSKGHCRADPRCLLQIFNVSSCLCLGTTAQNWNLSPGGSRLTEWYVYSLSGRKVKRRNLPLFLWRILVSIEMLGVNSWH